MPQEEIGAKKFHTPSEALGVIACLRSLGNYLNDHSFLVVVLVVVVVVVVVVVLLLLVKPSLFVRPKELKRFECRKILSFQLLCSLVPHWMEKKDGRFLEALVSKPRKVTAYRMLQFLYY